MQTYYSQNPQIQELWGFNKGVGGEFKADERQDFACIAVNDQLQEPAAMCSFRGKQSQ